MKFIADVHTHTIASGHAHSSLIENLKAAKSKGFIYLVVSDHACAMPNAPGEIYFETMPDVIPHKYDGVYLLTGCEANIIDINGNVDLPARTLAKLDIVIASMHKQTLPALTFEECTAAWLGVIKNPDIDILGHIISDNYPFDHKTVIEACAAYGKVVEINSHYLALPNANKSQWADIAALCAQYGVQVVVSSDAHFAVNIGNFDDAVEMLKKVKFPEELILNTDIDRFNELVKIKTGRNI